MDNNCANCTDDWKKGNLCDKCIEKLGFRGGSFGLSKKVIKIYDLYKSTKEQGEKNSCEDKLLKLGRVLRYGDILIEKDKININYILKNKKNAN